MLSRQLMNIWNWWETEIFGDSHNQGCEVAVSPPRTIWRVGIGSNFHAGVISLARWASVPAQE